MGQLPESGGGLERGKGVAAVAPKDDALDIDFVPPDALVPGHVRVDGASSSGSTIRSVLIGMGFKPSLVDRAIRERGDQEELIDLLVETLLGYSGQQRSNSESSDSLDNLFDEDDDAVNHTKASTASQPKQESDFPSGLYDEKKASLLMMNFSPSEIEFAVNKLGQNATIDQLVDYIVAAQIAAKFRNDARVKIESSEFTDEESEDEMLFRIMEKTLQLLEMGFSENEVSLALERHGAEIPVAELAESILGGGTVRPFIGRDKGYKYSSMHMKGGVGCYQSRFPTVSEMVKQEDFSSDALVKPSVSKKVEDHRLKRPKEENSGQSTDAPPCSIQNQDGSSGSRRFDFEEPHKGKRPKSEYDDLSSSSMELMFMEEKVNTQLARVGTPQPSSLNQGVAKRPFFFYGSVVNFSPDSWKKVSQFLLVSLPEFVDAQHFSALSRKEGYVHNLPTQNRFHLSPKSPMTIQEAIPSAKKWWPLWDTRTHVSCISSDLTDVPLLSERAERLLKDSQGVLSPEQQRDLLHHCRMKNLVWVGKYKLAPMEPYQLESILGYPSNYTESAGSCSSERLGYLKQCFQADTLGYHLSVLKPIFPGGLNLLSLFSGIGGVEMTLHRLGIKLNGVVAVESSEAKQRVLQRWWRSSGQTGELIQIDGIQKLTAKKLENMMNKFGSFDLIVCQNPCLAPSEGDKLSAFDFSQFYEFVRVLQRVRSMMDRKR
ncbi:hypothetical protein MLD38_038752 [Melastoma candidum]|uniref:Uncharacterized protein n=1 Tax=Melastoma candidum TaxID=119954 RepID=A0ACB9KZX9_9MYRT|nr:hypothetical protein MLD38_038752 [Melastoma candidum]